MTPRTRFLRLAAGTLRIRGRLLVLGAGTSAPPVIERDQQLVSAAEMSTVVPPELFGRSEDLDPLLGNEHVVAGMLTGSSRFARGARPAR